ncbi:MAG: hypothetical protein ACLR8P_01140 [Clostridium fessum]
MICLPITQKGSKREGRTEKRERERRMQEALLTIKKKYGKNAVLRGMNFEEGATAEDATGRSGDIRRRWKAAPAELYA